MSRIALGFAVVLVLASSLLGAAQGTPPSQTPPDDFLKGVYSSDTKDLQLPRVLREIKPKYTPDAMREKVQGTVKLQAVVLADGTVGRARILEGLHEQLDAAAIAAAKQWLFFPGQLKGEPVPVAMELMLQFRLH